MVKRMVRALVRAVTGSGWVLVPPVPPFDPGLAVPVPRPVADAPEVPLSKRERERSGGSCRAEPGVQDLEPDGGSLTGLGPAS